MNDMNQKRVPRANEGELSGPRWDAHFELWDELLGAEITGAAGNVHRQKAVVVGDGVDFTAQVEVDPDAVAKALDRLTGSLKGLAVQAGGELHDFVGDQFMATFDHADQAVGFARRVGLVAKRAAGLTFRMGIDVGDITVTATGRRVGRPINIAARVLEFAPPGGIILTEAAYIEAVNTDAKSLGPRLLKGIAIPIRIYLATTSEEIAIDKKEEAK